MLLLLSPSWLSSPPFRLRDRSLASESCLAKLPCLLETRVVPSRGDDTLESLGPAFRSEEGVGGLEPLRKAFFSEDAEDGLESVFTEALLRSECEDEGREPVTEAFLSE